MTDASHHVGDGRPDPRAGFELRQAPIDEVETDVPRPAVTVRPGGGLPGETYRETGHLAFRKAALLCYLLHYVTVSITGGEIHFAIDRGRVFPQGMLDGAHPFDEFSPVHGGEEPQAPDAVAHGKLVCRLLLVFRLDQLIDRQVRPGELLLHPGKGERKRGAVSLEATGKLRNKGTDQRRI